MTKLTDAGIKTVTTLEDADLIYNVDVSDATDDPAGTSAKITHQNNRDQIYRHRIIADRATLKTTGTGYQNGDVVDVQGMATAVDGDGGEYVLDTSGSLGPTANDDFFIISSTGGSNWYWRRLYAPSRAAASVTAHPTDRSKITFPLDDTNTGTIAAKGITLPNLEDVLSLDTVSDLETTGTGYPTGTIVHVKGHTNAGDGGGGDFRFDDSGNLPEVTGTHTGSNNAATLTDGAKSWTTNQFKGKIIYNDTDGSQGTITANTATTVTATLAGGTDNDWDTGDSYTISAADGGVVIKSTTGYWRRVLGADPIIPQFWGAVGDADRTTQATGTNNGAALQSFLDFGTNGYADWDTTTATYGTTTPADLLVPAGVYRTNQNLEFNQIAGGNATLRGAGQIASVIMAGDAAVTTLFAVVPSGGSGTHSFNNLRDIFFQAADYAATGVDTTDGTGLQIDRIRIEGCTSVALKINGWASTVQGSLISGYNLARTVRTAVCIEMPDTQAINGVNIIGNYIQNGLRGVDVYAAPQRLNIFGNIIDALDQAGVVLRKGCTGVDIIFNYFEDVGTNATSLQVASGPTNANFYGPIVGTRAWNSASFTLRNLRIRDNSIRDCGNRTAATFNAMADVEWKDNRLGDLWPLRSVIELIRDGANYTQVERVRVMQAWEQGVDSVNISSADAGTDTLTLDASVSLAVGTPITTGGGSLPAGLTSGQQYYSITEGEGLTAVQIAETIADAKAATPVNITGTGTGTFAVDELLTTTVNIDGVTDKGLNASGIIIEQAKDSVPFVGHWGNRSLGFHPASWPVTAGQLDMQEDSTTYEGHRVWEITSDATNPSTRQLDIDMESVTVNTLKGRQFRVSGLIKVTAGSGITFGVYVDTGSGFVLQNSQTETGSSYDELRCWLIDVPFDASAVRLDFRTTDATTAFLTKFSIADAAIEPDIVPIATDELPRAPLEVATGTYTCNPAAPTEIDSSGGAVTATLNDGNYIGQRFSAVMTDATTSSTLSVTNHETSDPEVFTFNAVDEALSLEWTGTEWVTIKATATV